MSLSPRSSGQHPWAAQATLSRLDSSHLQISPAVSVTRPLHAPATLPTHLLRNGLKMLPCAGLPLFFFWICCGNSVPRGQDAPASLVPGTGCWDGSEMAGGHSIRHPAPHLSHSLVAWPTAQEGQRGAGGSHNVLEWGGDVQSEGFLQYRGGETCSSGWCCAVQGVGPAMLRGGLAMCRTLQFKEGSCFTMGVLPCVFEGPSIGGAPSWRGLSMLNLCWRRTSCNSWMLLKCRESSWGLPVYWGGLTFRGGSCCAWSSLALK